MEYPIRIVHVLGGLDCGGAENLIMNIYREIDRSKIQFDFVIHTPKRCFFSDEVESLGGRIYVAPKFTGQNIIGYKKWWKSFLCNHKEYKIIHAHMTSTAYLYIEYAHQNKMKVIAHSHSSSYRGNFLQKFYKIILTRLLVSKADYLFACSKEAGINKFSKKGIYKKNYCEIKNGICTEKYVYDYRIREAMRRKLHVEDNIVFGHVGSFTDTKNHMYLLTVFSAIQKRNNKAKLVIAGDGPLRAQIEDKINELNISQHTILLGVRNDINKILMSMDVLLFPSFFEGLSLTVIEAQATGLRCLVSDRISREHKITELVQFESIDQSIDAWAKKALHMAETYERRNMMAEIKKSGYNIKSTVEWLEKFYDLTSH